MRIVVTGALGHIGSRLIRDLPSELPEAEITLLNHYSAQRYYTLFDLPAGGRYRFVGGDVLKEDLAALFRGADAVVHLASITRTVDGPVGKEIEGLNVVATERVASACARTNVPLAFVSTTSVYGTRAARVDESCRPDELVPQSSYARTKLREEEAVQEAGRTQGLQFTICRFGTIFGFSPGMRFDTAVNKFCWQANLGQPVTVWRTAMEQTRPYLDVADASAALVFLLRRKLFDRGIYNVLTLNTSVSHILRVIRRDIPELEVRLVESERMNELSFEVSDARFRALGFAVRGDLPGAIALVLEKLRGIRVPATQALRRAG